LKLVGANGIEPLTFAL